RMPLAVPGGRVLDTLSAVRAEYVSAPRAALTALAHNPAVAGISPDWRGRVMGLRHIHRFHGGHHGGNANQSVLAATSVGGDAGQAGVGAGVTVALLDT